ncbi:MAG: alpha-rhamnosidase [Prevotella sp.]
MWITYPGDFEIWLGNKFNNRRTERGAIFPPFWKQDSHYVTVEFSRTVCLDEAEDIQILAEGTFNLMLDGKLQYGQPAVFTVPAGEHKLNMKVWNQATPPALHIEGKTIHTDSSWLATYEDKIWIDENGIAHGSGIYVPAATHPMFQTASQRPSGFALPTVPIAHVRMEEAAGGMLYDFGKETMGYIVLNDVTEGDNIQVFYGESREEALDHDHCETLDFVHIKTSGRYVIPDSKAFRFVHVVAEGKTIGNVAALYEYLPHDEASSGSFESSDSLLNDIWRVSAYTLDLTTREFFMDGIKRDRWTWSGDAIQSYLMNYYLHFDSETVKRTIRQLRGKDPVTAHVNTIMDYTFYWFMSVLDYYTFTADIDFVREMYPRMRTLMDYVLGRLDADGFAEGRPDDWIFIDWVDFPMHKRGVVCFEQILFSVSLRTMSLAASLLRDNPLECPPQGSLSVDEYREDAERYTQLYNSVRQKTDDTFWDNNAHAYIHSIEDGKPNKQITKFPNMFALLYNDIPQSRRDDIIQHVMLNPDVEAITTPYMRFYELEALCKAGYYDDVIRSIKDYWGGMLAEGATSFWEKYVPSEHGTEHLQMYGRPYGKSLCHAWGASPLYLLGKYFLGVRPLTAGYETWECTPHLGPLDWMSGAVPTPHGPIHIYMDRETVRVKSPITGGKLHVNGMTVSIDTTDEIEVRIV